MIPGHVAIVTDGNVCCAAIPWRFRGRMQLSVVIKATLAIAPGAVAALQAPQEIVREDRTFGLHPSRSLEAASDLAPYLPRCDVTFVGHAYAPGGRPAPASSVRLGIARDDRPLLDKTLHVFGDRSSPAATPASFTRMPLVYERALGGPGEANPVGVETPNVVHASDAQRPGGFGPISRFWASRKRLLGRIDRAALDGPVADIPEAMPWEYFQAAPSDQQIEHLRGGEWLVLDGLHPAQPRVSTRLPAARGAARVLLGAGSAAIPLELACDALAIDGDKQLLALSWRARWEVTCDESALEGVRILAALETDAPVDWRALAAAHPTSAAVSPPANAAEGPVQSPGEGTVALSGEARLKAATPFVSTTPAVGDSTLGLAPDQQAAARARPLAPFALSPEGASGAAAPRIPGAPWSGVAIAAAPAALPGEATLTQRADPPTPRVAAATPQPPPPEAPPASASVAREPPAAPAAPPASARSAAALAAPAASHAAAPATQVASHPAPAAAPPPSPPRKAPARKDTDALAAGLRAAGASDEDVTSLLRALRPPPPPPADDD